MNLVKIIPDNVDIDCHEKLNRRGCFTVALLVVLFWVLIIIAL